MHQRKQPPATLPAAHAVARVPSNDGDAAAALSVAAAWVSATHATEHRARPSIVSVCNALDAARAAHSRATFDALSRALVRWCADASARGNAVDLIPAMLGAVNAAAALDAAAGLPPVDGVAAFAQWCAAGRDVPEPWRTRAVEGAAAMASCVSYDVPRG